jgi:hypothetical protein
MKCGGMSRAGSAHRGAWGRRDGDIRLQHVSLCSGRVQKQRHERVRELLAPFLRPAHAADADGRHAYRDDHGRSLRVLHGPRGDALHRTRSLCVELAAQGDWNAPARDAPAWVATAIRSSGATAPSHRWREAVPAQHRRGPESSERRRYPVARCPRRSPNYAIGESLSAGNSRPSPASPNNNWPVL